MLHRKSGDRSPANGRIIQAGHTWLYWYEKFSVRGLGGEKVMQEYSHFGHWLKQQLEECGLTARSLSIRLDGLLTQRTIQCLLEERGNPRWESIPGDLKGKLIPGLENILGPLPDQFKKPIAKVPPHRGDGVNAPTRPFTHEEVNRLLGEGKPSTAEPEKKKSDEVRQVTMALDYDYRSSSDDVILEWCGCGTSIRDSHKGRCPECKRLSDGSH